MNKRQKCSSSSSSNINNQPNTNSNDNPILSSNSANNIKEDLSLSSSNDTTIVNDTVPNWVQSGGQVRLTTAASRIFLTE
jgi:hypothetical protein